SSKRSASSSSTSRRPRGCRSAIPSDFRPATDMAKLPTRSPTHEDVPIGRLSSMGLEIEEIADGDTVALSALIELAEDRGRPVSHYLAAIPLATELRLAAD